MGDDFAAVGGDDMAAQMREAYAGVTRVLAMFGAEPSDVVDETLFVTDVMAAATVRQAGAGRGLRGGVRGGEHADRCGGAGFPRSHDRDQVRRARVTVR